MNGFAITGPKPTPCFDPLGPDGIDTIGQAEAQIEGPGKVQKLRVGIHVNGSNKSQVQRIVAIRNCVDGILVDASQVEINNNIVLHSTPLGPPTPHGGISINGNDNHVRGNEVHDHIGFVFPGYGIRVLSGTGNNIEKNSVTSDSRLGIWLEPGTSNNRIDNNLILKNSLFSISRDTLDEGVGNTVTQNNVCETGTGAAATVCAISPTGPFDIDHEVGNP